MDSSDSSDDDTEQKVETLVEHMFHAEKNAHELSERTDPIEEAVNKLREYIHVHYHHSATLADAVDEIHRNFSELKTAIQEHGEVLDTLKKGILSNKVHRNEHLEKVVHKKRKSH